MSVFEPPIAPDDTQPQHYTLDDTHPTRPIRPRRPFDLWLLVLGAVITLTTISLLCTLGLAILPTVPRPTPMPISRAITLMIEGNPQTVHTTAQTVEDLLKEQGIQLSADDAVSDPLNSLLRDGMTLYLDKARDVQLIVDGQARLFRTPFDNPYDILKSAGIHLGPSDRVYLDGTLAPKDELPLWPVPVTQIMVERAVTIHIEDGGQRQTRVTTADTVGDALFEAQIVLYLADQIQPDVSAPLTEAMTIRIQRAQPITITADGQTFEARVLGGSVREAVAQTGILLADMDYTIPSADTPVAAGMQIEVVRATETLVTENEVIPYQTVYQPDETLELDTRAIIQGGLNGTAQIIYRVRMENGVEIHREQISSAIVAEPVDEIIAYGTQIVLRTIDTPEGPREYWRVLRNMVTTSYHPAALGGDDVTSIGMKLQKGIIAGDPNIIPYRTQLYVPGYGLGIMADTGGPRRTPYWLDLGYSDADFVGWSTRADVYLLTPVPEKINYLLPAR